MGVRAGADPAAKVPRGGRGGGWAVAGSALAVLLLLHGLAVGWLALSAGAAALGVWWWRSGAAALRALVAVAPGWRRVAGGVVALHLVVAGVLWLPPWRRTWTAAWLPQAGSLAPAAGALWRSARRDAATGDTAGAVQVERSLAAVDPSAADLEGLGRAELAAGQADGPPAALDTAGLLGARGAAWDAAVGAWYAAFAAAGGPARDQMVAWWFYARAAALAPGQRAYAAGAAKAEAAAEQALRLGSWAQQ